MKRISYVLLGALLALGVNACRGDNYKDNNKKEEEKKDNNYVPPEKEEVEEVEIGYECKKSAKGDNCVKGSKCTYIPLYETSVCLPSCTKDEDCSAYFTDSVCGGNEDPSNGVPYFDGVCVDEAKAYSFILDGQFPSRCEAGTISTDGWWGYPDASLLFDDAPADSALLFFGSCVPVCASNGNTRACPTVDLPEPGEKDSWVEVIGYKDVFGINGKQPICVSNEEVDKMYGSEAGIKVCTIPAYTCDPVLFACDTIFGRQKAEYDYTLRKYTQDGYECNLAGFYGYGVNLVANSKTDENKLTNYNEGLRVYGTCDVVCSNNDICTKCNDSADPDCNLPQGMIRRCMINKNISADAASDDIRGNLCDNLYTCNDDSDCTKDKIGYAAKCFDPNTETLKGDNNKEYKLLYVTEKFCLADEEEEE